MSEPEEADATRRTRFANERTYLARWGTGLTTLAVAIGAGNVVPALADAARWPAASWVPRTRSLGSRCSC